MSDVTLVITSCGRKDLLRRTISSFIKYNTFPIKKGIIIEDSANKDIMDSISGEYPEFTVIKNENKLGQVKSIDKAYSLVDSEYIFHCEDDWEFYSPGFIEASLKVLNSDNKILQLQLRHIRDINGHPSDMLSLRIVPPDINIVNLQLNYLGVWHGFSFNPGLKRVSDYLLAKPYAAIGHEGEVGKFYKDLGYKVVVQPNVSYVAHIGDGRHVFDLKACELPK